MLSYKSEIGFEGKDFNADKVKLHESMRQKMEKIYVNESSFGLPDLENYLFMGRDDNSLEKFNLKKRTIG